MNKTARILTIFILGLGISISSYVYAKIEHLNNTANYDDIQFPIELDLEYKCTTINSSNTTKHHIVITIAEEEHLKIEQINYKTIDNKTIYNFQKVSLNSEQYPYIGSKLTASVYEEDNFLFFDKRLDCHPFESNRIRCYSNNGNECSLTMHHNQNSLYFFFHEARR